MAQIKTVLLCALGIPLSMSFWIIRILNRNFLNKHEEFDELVVPPGRWFLACLLPLLIAVYGYKKKSLDLSGALSGFLVGYVLMLSNYSFMASMVVFFLSGSRATKVRAHIKKKLEAEFKEGGQRGWVQVLCNGGMGTQFAIIYLLDVGASERPINFVADYKAAYLSIGVLATFAACNGDTWASELGTVFSNSDPFLVTSFQRVPKQTNGGMSFEGTVFSALGGLVVGIIYYLTVYCFSESKLWNDAPPQWPLIIFGAFSGFLGSFFDSVLGATLQYSGLNKKGQVVLHPSLAVKHISGRNVLDNNSVNLISTILMGLIMPSLCYSLWPMF